MFTITRTKTTELRKCSLCFAVVIFSSSSLKGSLESCASKECSFSSLLFLTIVQIIIVWIIVDVRQLTLQSNRNSRKYIKMHLNSPWLKQITKLKQTKETTVYWIIGLINDSINGNTRCGKQFIQNKVQYSLSRT